MLAGIYRNREHLPSSLLMRQSRFGVEHSAERVNDRRDADGRCNGFLRHTFTSKYALCETTLAPQPLIADTAVRHSSKSTGMAA